MNVLSLIANANFIVQFQSRRIDGKKSEESWAGFSDDLMFLVNKAFANLQEEVREQLAMSKYLDHLRDPQVSFDIKQRRPRKLSEAVAATIQLESYLPRTNQVSQISKSEEPPIPEQTIAAIQSTQKDLFGVV